MTVFIIKIKVTHPVVKSYKTFTGCVIASNSVKAKALALNNFSRDLAIANVAAGGIARYYAEGKGIAVVECKKMKDDFVYREGER